MDGAFEEFKERVLESLDRMHADQVRVAERLRALEEKTAALMVRAGAWGLVAGMLPAIAVVLYSLVK